MLKPFHPETCYRLKHSHASWSPYLPLCVSRQPHGQCNAFVASVTRGESGKWAIQGLSTLSPWCGWQLRLLVSFALVARSGLYRTDRVCCCLFIALFTSFSQLLSFWKNAALEFPTVLLLVTSLPCFSNFKKIFVLILCEFQEMYFDHIHPPLPTPPIFTLSHPSCLYPLKSTFSPTHIYSIFVA